MKKRILISSVLTIVLCFSLIVGSTFALFTSEVEYNIAVTSGKVELTANASLGKVYSAAIAQSGANANDLLPGLDGNAFAFGGNNYKHQEQTAVYSGVDNSGANVEGIYFANKGYVVYNNGTLTITNITPGDKVELNVGATNASNVAIKYRYVVKGVNGEIGDVINDPTSTSSSSVNLAGVINVSVSGVNGTMDNNGIYHSDWIDPNADGSIDKATISIELPVWVGNNYQNLTNLSYQIIVEAVQANGVSN